MRSNIAKEQELSLCLRMAVLSSSANWIYLSFVVFPRLKADAG